MVGNNTPVFFIRDPMKFQHFIRSQKRRADSDLRDHDMQWDFWSLSPESAHQVTWLMGDRGIPKSWRHMNGYSSHTYMWVNANGERFWVKYHFKTDQGIEFLTQEDADRLAGEDGDYHRRDLFEAIDRGEFPSWTLRVQVMPFEEASVVPLQPLRPDQGVAPRRLPAARGRAADTRPQPQLTSTQRSSRPPSSRTTWCPASGSARTRCSWPGSSPTPTPIGPAWESTTSRSR